MTAAGGGGGAGLAYRYNNSDKQPTLRVSLVFIYLFIVFLKEKAIFFFLAQNSVLGTMYLIPDGIRYFFFWYFRYIVSDIGKYEFSVLGLYLIPKFFIRCKVPNTEILALHLHSNWN